MGRVSQENILCEDPPDVLLLIERTTGAGKCFLMKQVPEEKHGIGRSNLCGTLRHILDPVPDIIVLLMKKGFFICSAGPCQAERAALSGRSQVVKVDLVDWMDTVDGMDFVDVVDGSLRPPSPCRPHRPCRLLCPLS
jgi:hypothetical protein